MVLGQIKELFNKIPGSFKSIFGIFIILMIIVLIYNFTSFIRFHAKKGSFENYKLIARGMTRTEVNRLMADNHPYKESPFFTVYRLKGWSGLNTKKSIEVTVEYDSHNVVTNVRYHEQSTSYHQQ